MSTQTYNVTGMSCGHCEMAVNKEVSKLPGITNISVSAATGLLTFETDGSASPEDVIAAVDEAGYDAALAQ